MGPPPLALDVLALDGFAAEVMMNKKNELVHMVYVLLFASAFYVLVQVMGWWEEEEQGSLIWIAALIVVPWAAWVLFDTLFPEKDKDDE